MENLISLLLTPTIKGKGIGIKNMYAEIIV